MTQYVICADGACSGNPGPGGWAYEIWDQIPAEGNELASGSGSSPETTNNIMELRAAICAIETLLEGRLLPAHVKLRFDSEYVLKGIFEWRDGWKAKGWKTAAKKPVKNVDLWKDLDALLERAASDGWSFEADWVKGHEGDFGNERVDTMACLRRDEAKEEVISGGRSEDAFEDTSRHIHDDVMQIATFTDIPAQDREITADQVSMLRDLLNPYVEGDVTIKDVLRALRRNAEVLGMR